MNERTSEQTIDGRGDDDDVVAPKHVFAPKGGCVCAYMAVCLKVGRAPFKQTSLVVFTTVVEVIK